ncbi:hypothetical protein KIW84_UN0469 [Lathyrus oleraceus]|nr:hypothetical protein KIW84_UN0469 [Pisum sativum]
MRRCQDTVFELESFLEREHGFVVPCYWRWDPHTPSVHDKNMKKVILASLSENVARFSGCNQLGYEVAQTGQHVQLHPSSSLLVFAQKPSWVVFGELLLVSNEYLVCVSAVEFQSLYDLQPALSFDVSKMEERKLQTKTLTGFGTILLKRFCGKSNSNLLGHVSRIRKACLDERIFVEVKVDENLIQLYAASHDMNTATMLVSDVLEYEKKRLRTESATWNKVSNPKTQLSKPHNANSLIQSLPYFIHHRRRPPPPLPPNFNSDNQSPRRKLPRHQFPITKPLSRIPSVDPLKQHFLVGSLCHRTISSTSDAGIIETLISDTSIPENVIIVGITVDSCNNRILAVIHAVKPLPPFNALAAYDLKSGNRLFLSPLPTDEEALANDVAVDYNGNAYVTNSIGNYIWKVNVKGEASIFSKSSRFTEHPVDRDTPYSYIGLNGIAYVSSGDYLLVVQSNTGKVFKVDADDGTARHVLLNEDLTHPDGVVFRSGGVVLVVSPQANKLWLLKSNNGWGEGVVYDKIDLESEGYPTSVVSRGMDKMYVLYGYFLEGLLGNSEREGFRIEEIMSPKESEGENVWLYVMIGFGMVYFVYWRFQMGQLVKHMNKKIN